MKHINYDERKELMDWVLQKNPTMREIVHISQILGVDVDISVAPIDDINKE